MAMTPQAAHRKDEKRSERWIDGIRELARARGHGDAVWGRAVELTRQLNIAPWIALAVAERKVSLKEAPLLDRASRCADLRAGVLDKGLTVAELKTTLPYASYLLAVELTDFLGRAEWDLRKVTAVVEGLLNEEKRLDEDGRPLPVRARSLVDYAAIVKRVRRLIEQTGCNMRMALDVEAGRLTEDYVVQYVRQRRMLVQEELRANAPPRVPGRDFVPRRSAPFPAPRGAGRPYTARPFPPRPPETGDARASRS